MATSPAVRFSHQPPQITILSDHASQDRSADQMANDPIATLVDKDQLNLETRLASTFDILRHRNTRCPLAVAVYGDWGTGKTSAMRWLETRLNEWNNVPAPDRNGHPHAYPVWFDPWRYHSKEEVWRGIIAEVILSLFRVSNLNDENALPRMVQAVKKFGGFLGRSFIHAMANLEFTAGGKANVSGLAEGEMKFTAKGEMFRDIWEEYDKAAHPHKAHLNQFEETLRSWVNDFLGPQAPSDKKAKSVTREPARLVLFIDDLDRCLPEVTLEVIEALKLYLNIDHLIFVVGLDETVVRSVVAEHYKKAGVDTAKAARYLDKVFQVDLRIPPSEAQMPDYMKTQIAALNDATDHYWQKIMERSGHRETLESVLISLARNNPREVKRLLNSALLRGRAASLDETLSDQDGKPDATQKPEDHATWQDGKRAERFAQGVQLFLLQRLLADQIVQSEDLLTYANNLRWFAEASHLLREGLKVSGFDWATFLRHLPDLEKLENTVALSSMGFTKADGTIAEPMSMESQEVFARLYMHLMTNQPKADNALWTSDIFLQLLQVPFSQAVAEHFPPTGIAEATAANDRLDLGSLPDFLRERIATSAKVPLADLRTEHLSGVTELNLDDLPVTSSLLRSLLLGSSWERISLQNCTSLTDTKALVGQHQLQRLVLAACTGLEDTTAFDGLAGLESLIGLDLMNCPGLTDTIVLSELKNLQWLYLNGCTGLQRQKAFKGLAALKGMQRLYLGGCTGLNDTADLVGLRQLQRLALAGCTGLDATAFVGLARLENLIGLDVMNCPGLTDTVVLSGLRQLQWLYLNGCTSLQGQTAFKGLSALKGMQRLYLADCTGLKSLPDLTSMQELQLLDLSGCTGLKAASVQGVLARLPKLDNLVVTPGFPFLQKDSDKIREALGSQCKISWRTPQQLRTEPSPHP